MLWKPWGWGLSVVAYFAVNESVTPQFRTLKFLCGAQATRWKTWEIPFIAHYVRAGSSNVPRGTVDYSGPNCSTWNNLLSTSFGLPGTRRAAQNPEAALSATTPTTDPPQL